jgi:hypothetical protein
MGLKPLRDRISDSLAIREAETALRTARLLDRRNVLIAILFGLVAVPPIASEVVEPLISYLGLWRPADASAAKLYMIAVAVAFTALLILAIVRVVGVTENEHHEVNRT